MHRVRKGAEARAASPRVQLIETRMDGEIKTRTENTSIPASDTCFSLIWNGESKRFALPSCSAVHVVDDFTKSLLFALTLSHPHDMRLYFCLEGHRLQ